MKFPADMGISASVAGWLSETGHDVVHVRDVDPRSPDMDIMEKATTEVRVVLTSDLDFGDTLTSLGGTGPSVVLFRRKA